MTTKRQTGFGVVPILAVTAVIAVLGLGGYWLFMTQLTKPAVTNTVMDNHQNNSANSQPNNAQTRVAPTQTDNYLHIKELGIKIKLSDGIKDAVYALFQPQPVDGSKVIGISAQSLINSSAGDKNVNCSASSGALGIIIATPTVPTNMDGQPLPVDNKTLFKLSNTYYQYNGPQTACGTSGSGYEALGQSLAQKKGAFAEAFKTVQLDK